MSLRKLARDMARKRKQDKNFDMKEHMAKIRSMRGKGKRKGKGTRLKKVTSELKEARRDIKTLTKLVGQVARKAGIKSPARKKPTTRRKRR